ncbi:MAG: UvrD-helicase domain-containing protein [Chloroflexi bacterium]|nr:UvrD-helicase domain-containing protein [Chloroflexota bacterium]
MPPITASSAALVRLLTGGPSGVVLERGVVRFTGRAAVPVGAVDRIETRPSWFWTRLTVREGSGAVHAIGGLAREDAERLAAAVREEAARAAGEATAELLRLGERLTSFYGGDRYRRHSASAELQADIATAGQRSSGALLRSHLPPDAAGALARIRRFASPAAFEQAREEANDRFVAAHMTAVAEATAGVLSNPPTAEQAQAIATDEDVTLVLAGAGTGKTAVITGKVAHLVRDEGVAPEEVLVLAFNRKAADEIRERLPDDLAGAHVATFHAFGLRVIAAAEGSPALSRLAEDEAKLIAAIDGILVELLADPKQARAVTEFIERHRTDYRSQFDFETPGAYYDHVRRSELRTLAGDLVKSFEELEIANFLTLNGVRYDYERPYPVETATAWHRQYRPDFHLPDHDLYIEHFALDRDGRPPASWTGYAEGVAWKQGIHERYGTTLVETYSWQRREGVLRERLREQLAEAGVTLEPVPMETLLRDLAGWLISWLAQLTATVLSHVKTSGISPETLRARAVRSADRARGEAFLDVFDHVLARYGELLGGEKDFHDLINDAAAHIGAGRWASPYRYVLVDEFQDISTGRMALLEALDGPGVAHFLVGDDWQSIYRFAGSDVALVRDCGHHLGHVRERALGRTFRFARGILDPSTAFVTRNPEQTQRALRPAEGVPDGGVAVIASGDRREGVEDALRDIAGREGADGPPLSVLVLGRYRGSREAVPKPRRGRLRVEFSTVHAAKGREADYVVVLDLRDARLGFPAQIADDPLLHLVLPPPPGGGYPHAEERRLFYVALTRARRGTYLVVDALWPSVFVEELMREGPGLRRLGEFRRDRTAACPRCRTGRLDISGSGRSMGCLNFPFCRYRAPRCASCKGGFVVIDGDEARCTSASCDAAPSLCELCGQGVMVARRGPTGAFLGCSQFASDQPCTNTRNLASRR